MRHKKTQAKAISRDKKHKLTLPFNPSQACREFGSVCFVVCDAGARQKRRSMIKLLCNKCNGRASSSQIKKSSS